MSSAQLPRYHPDQPDDPIPPYAAIPDEGPLDQSHPDELLPAAVNGGAASNDSPPARQSSTLQLPRLVLGCATFGDGIFAASDAVRSDMPARVVRLALRSGMTAFDTGACAEASYLLPPHQYYFFLPEQLSDEVPYSMLMCSTLVSPIRDHPRPRPLTARARVPTVFLQDHHQSRQVRPRRRGSYIRAGCSQEERTAQSQAAQD